MGADLGRLKDLTLDLADAAHDRDMPRAQTAMAEVWDQHGGVDGVFVITAGLSDLALQCNAVPAADDEHFVGFEVYSLKTGEPVNPDCEKGAADAAWAMRLITAYGNKDTAQFNSVFWSRCDEPTPIPLLDGVWTLVDMVGAFSRASTEAKGCES